MKLIKRIDEKILGDRLRAIKSYFLNKSDMRIIAKNCYGYSYKMVQYYNKNKALLRLNE